MSKLKRTTVKPNRAQRRQAERRPHPNAAVEARKTISGAGGRKHITQATDKEVEEVISKVKSDLFDIDRQRQVLNAEYQRNIGMLTECENEQGRRVLQKAGDAQRAKEEKAAAKAAAKNAKKPKGK